MDDLGLLVAHGPLARSLPYSLLRIENFHPSFGNVMFLPSFHRRLLRCKISLVLVFRLDLALPLRLLTKPLLIAPKRCIQATGPAFVEGS
jgi:hypothetical protein